MKTFLNRFLIIIFIPFIFSCGDRKNKVVEASVPSVIYEVESLTNHEFTFNSDNLKNAENPDLTLQRGKTYQFKVETFGHPFLIKTKAVIGKEGVFNQGVIENGTEYGTITFVVPMDAPDTLYYICKYHKMMTGKLLIVD